jgi:hypothetical protein
MVSKMQLNEQFMEPKQGNQADDLHVDKVLSENVSTTKSNLYHYYVDINKQCKELQDNSTQGFSNKLALINLNEK